jgi:hypothetical protein
MVIVSVVEQFGFGFLVASSLASLLMAIAIWQSLPTVPILIFCALLSVLLGAVLTGIRWPTRRTAALEADRQLRLDDLLSSALLSANPHDDFATAMLTMADARCAMHAPSEVIFRRFGVTSWGAIGLAMSVTATLAVIPFGAAKSQATDANASVLSATSNDLPSAIQSNDLTRVNSSNNDPMSDGASKITTQGDLQADARSTDARTNQASTVANPSGTGGGTATTKTKSGTGPRPGETIARPSNANGSLGSGGTASNLSSQNHESGTGIERGNISTAAASFHGDGTSSGDIIVKDSNIPPEHRDLVRDFFNGK